MNTLRGWVQGWIQECWGPFHMWVLMRFLSRSPMPLLWQFVCSKHVRYSGDKSHRNRIEIAASLHARCGCNLSATKIASKITYVNGPLDRRSTNGNLFHNNICLTKMSSWNSVKKWQNCNKISIFSGYYSLCETKRSYWCNSKGEINFQLYAFTYNERNYDSVLCFGCSYNHKITSICKN